MNQASEIKTIDEQNQSKSNLNNIKLKNNIIIKK